MIVGVHHFGTRAEDPARAMEAFSRFMPFSARPLGDGVLGQGPNLFVYAERGPDPQPTPVHAVGIAHACVQSQDPVGARARLESVGVKLVAEPAGLGTGFHYCYARDRNGRLIELETAPMLPTELQGWFGHVALVTADLPRLMHFYEGLLGGALQPGGRFQNNPRFDHVAGMSGLDVEVAWLHGLNLTLEFWCYHAPPLTGERRRQCGYAHLAFEVENAAAALDKAIAHGAAPEDRAPVWCDAPAAWARDPDDNVLLFVQIAPQRPELSLSALSHPRWSDHVHRIVMKARQNAQA